MFQAAVHALVQALFHKAGAQLFHVREVAPRFEHVGEEHDLFRRAHVRPARGVVADRVEHLRVLHAEGVFGKVRARKLVQYGRGHLFGRGEPRKFGRGERQIFRRVVHRRRLHDLLFGNAVFARQLRREQRHAHGVLAPRGFQIPQRRLYAADAVQAFRFDVVDDAFGQVGPHVLAQRAQHPRLGGRNVAPRVREQAVLFFELHLKAELFAFERRVALAVADDELRQRKDGLRFAPGVKVAQHVRPDQKVQLRVGITAAEVRERETGIADAARVAFVGADFAVFHLRKGEARHLQPVLGGRRRAVLVRREVSGDGDELFRAERLDGGARHIHMFCMNGVERPAENRDLHLRLVSLWEKARPRIPAGRIFRAVFISIAHLSRDDKV